MTSEAMSRVGRFSSNQIYLTLQRKSEAGFTRWLKSSHHICLACGVRRACSYCNCLKSNTESKKILWRTVSPYFAYIMNRGQSQDPLRKTSGFVTENSRKTWHVLLMTLRTTKPFSSTKPISYDKTMFQCVGWVKGSTVPWYGFEGSRVVEIF